LENQLVPRPGNPNWVGRSGNPAGRPIGARGRFSQQFIVDLSAAWERYGAEALAKTAEQFPDRFVGICAHLIPKDVQVSLTARLPADLQPEDLQLMLEVVQAVKQALPSAADRPPGAVLEHVLERLK
jgi:hypothetical protein